MQSAYKPGSVLDDHLSNYQIALAIQRLTTHFNEQLLSFKRQVVSFLAVDRVYLCTMSP